MQKICRHCNSSFEIIDADLRFYEETSPVIHGKKYSIPPPTLCHDCRYRERLTWRNERKLYRRKCDATGKDLVSIFSPDKSWPPVYEQQYWWSDQWDPKQYGREVDFARPFFEQWAELFRATPQIAMNNQQSENCEFTNQSQRNKDCYIVFCSDESRDCLYGMWSQRCINCMDWVYLEKSELCYEILNGSNCYRCAFSQNLVSCSDVYFSKNCIGCKNCLGCINIRNKEYWIFNEQFSKEEYHKQIQQYDLGSHASLQELGQKAAAFFQGFPHKCYVGANAEDFSGDYVNHVRDAHHVYNCRNDEHLTYCQDVWGSNNCQDMTETVYNNFCYSLEGCAYSTNTYFSKKFCDLNNSFYCSHCNFSKSLFGCIALRQAEYCILNKQYTKEAYEGLVPKIIEYMRSTGEWGEHFPHIFSPYAYNETVAQEYFPRTKEEALTAGYSWREETDGVTQAEKIIPASDLPDSIDDVSDDIIGQPIRCEITGRPFCIIKQELDFYRNMRLPLPHLHYDERHRRRMAIRNPRKLWNRNCAKCQKPIATSFSPERPEIVYCEECYLKEVY